MRSPPPRHAPKSQGPNITARLYRRRPHAGMTAPPQPGLCAYGGERRAGTVLGPPETPEVCCSIQALGLLGRYRTCPVGSLDPAAFLIPNHMNVFLSVREPSFQFAFPRPSSACHESVIHGDGVPHSRR